MSDMRSMLRQADRHVLQAKCILTLLQYSSLETTSYGDHVIIDEAVISCALEGVNELLDKATDIQYQMGNELDKKLLQAAS